MKTFAEIFDTEPEASAAAPGRVNLLGEHTDYNDGYVLPTTIPQVTRVRIARSANLRWRFYADTLGEHVEYEDAGAPPNGFGRYVYGCIEAAKSAGARIAPLLVHISSEVPMGAGLSSSAALEVATLRALRSLFALEYDDVELARLAQRAEVEYAGVRCGILDQMACSLADAEHMLFLDTRTLERRLLPLPHADLIVIDSGITRTLATSGYNERRAQCEEASQLLGITALRDVRDIVDLQSLPARLERRARHVVSENARVLEAASGVDAERFGELMNESHASLRDDYDVSTPLLDQLVSLLQRNGDVYGARLTGAGFGGACVALAKVGSALQVKQSVLRDYAAVGGSGRALV